MISIIKKFFGNWKKTSKLIGFVLVGMMVGSLLTGQAQAFVFGSQRQVSQWVQAGSNLVGLRNETNNLRIGSDGSLYVDTATGRVGIGTILPTAALHLKAGSTGANSAPLKFTAGSNLDNVEAGAMEFDGTNLYFTPAALRKTIAFTDSNITGNAATATNLTGLTATITNLNSVTGLLGTAAFTASSDYATAAQGTLATNALPSASFTNAAVTGKLITGYVSGSGTVAATDTILQAINKLNGNSELKAPIASPTFTGSVSGITSTMVGLGNVTNESKATMFASPTFTGTVTIPTPFTLGATSVTATGTELNLLDGVTATTAELNILDGVTATAAKLNYLSSAGGTTGTNSTNLVFSTSPTLVAPILGAATATSINGNTITTGTGTLTLGAGKTLTASNTLTLTATDGSTLAIGTGGTLGTGAYATIANYAPLASPTFTGIPAAPTAVAGTNTTQLATTAFATTADNLKANLASPTFTGTVTIPTPFTLGAVSVTTNGTELNLIDGLTATGAELNILDGVTGVTAAELTNLGGVTATATELNYVDGVTSAIQTQLGLKAPLASPSFTGTITSAGSATFSTADTSISFGSDVRQMLNLYSTSYGIGVQGSTEYFRTSSNFAFYEDGVHSDTALDPGTGGTARMVILSGGNIGIGTITAATNRLHIYGGSLSVNTAGAAEHHAIGGISIQHGGSNFGNRAMQISSTAGNPSYIIQAYGDGTAWYTYGVNTDNTFRINPGADAITGSAFVMNSSGNIGIGTAAPLSKLSVGGNGNSTYGIYGNGVYGIVGNGVSIGVQGIGPYGLYGSGTNYAVYGSGSGTGIGGYFASASGYALITGGGNVGIGTTTPTSKLYVNGTSYFNGPVTVNGVMYTDNINTIGRGEDNWYNVSTGSIGAWTSIYSYGPICTGNGSGACTGANGTVIGSNNTSATNNIPNSGTVFFNSGNVGIGTASPSYQLQLSTDSAAKPTHNVWTIASDARIKTDIGNFTDGLETVLKIRPTMYKYNGLGGVGFNDTEIHIGIIAQELELVAPYMVETNKGKIGGTTVNDFKSYQGHALPFILVNAIKEQQGQIDDLKLSLNDLGTINPTSTLDIGKNGANHLQWLINGLQALGINIQNGIASFTEIIAVKFTGGEANIGKVQTEQMTARQMCVSGTDGETVCLTKDQLKDLIARAGSSVTISKTYETPVSNATSTDSDQ
ncbi:MAG: tail fiber domain-containing protein [Candidatus Paceibacterota bacterium]